MGVSGGRATHLTAVWATIVGGVIRADVYLCRSTSVVMATS